MSNLKNNTALKEKYKDIVSKCNSLVFYKSMRSLTHFFEKLTTLNFTRKNIYKTDDIDVSLNLLLTLKPKFVFCEYFNRNDVYWGDIYDLYEEYQSQNKDKVYFVLLTAKDSLHIISEVIQRNVDIILLKPFHQDILEELVFGTLEKFEKPSAYELKINEALELIKSGNVNKAEAEFTIATRLSDKPCLAFYHLGNIKKDKKLFDLAQRCYLNGLRYNQHHYHCLLGLFDILMEIDDVEKAYKVVKRFISLYVSSHDHFSQGVRLSVVNDKLSEIDFFLDIYSSMDVINIKVKKYIWAALFVSARYFLEKGNKDDATSLLERMISDSEYNPFYIRMAAELCLEKEILFSATTFIKLFKDTECDDYTVTSELHYFYQNKSFEDQGLINKFLESKFESFLMHTYLMQLYTKESKLSALKDSYQSACEIWPEREKFFKHFKTW